MRERWEKCSTSSEMADGQPVPQKISFIYEPAYKKPKLLLKSPSVRALRNYNNLSIVDNSQNTYDNLNFIPESGNVDFNTYEEAYTSTIRSNDSKQSIFPNTYDLYDYTTLGSSSVRTNVSNNGSELGSEKNEMGSTTKLVTTKMEMSCQSWFSRLETVLCTISLAAGFGNLYRLPQTALLQGGLPFLLAYVILVILVGLPLLFLELGIGQLAQEGFIKSWRAVPFFRGIGYVKLIAGCLLSIYYPLYMGLSLYYIIWISATSVPFKQCANVKMKKTGYSADGQDGQQCLRKTFLESPFNDLHWYGIFAGILFVIWVIVIVLSIRRTKSFIRSISLLLFPLLGCIIALTVKAVFTEDHFQSLEKLGQNIDWSILQNSYIWYYAALQVFFSTNVGFGTFITNAGIIYNKVNPLLIALGFITVNLVFGVGSVIICYIFAGELDTIRNPGDVSEIHLLALMYTITVKSDQEIKIKSEERNEAKIWAIVAYAAILLAGFISMATITYTLLKAITVENRRRLKWWQTSIVLSFVGLVLGCGVLLEPDFRIVRLLDHYLVGNFILISVIIEVCALIAFYGTERIKSDFEFMLGHILSNVWLILWWLLPLLLTGIFAWALITIPEDEFVEDPEWLYATGWAVVLTAAIFILVIGIYTVTKMDGYTVIDKFKASLKPSNKWGPKDPILRHTWMQWNSKAKQGERDFTLKRRGTGGYTRSVKRNAKKATQNRTSNSSTEYVEPYYLQNEQNPTQNGVKPLRVTSIVDSLDPPSPVITVNIRNTYSNNRFKTSINPLSRTSAHEIQDSPNSGEGYGTFRKGPYVIPETNITHVCHRRFSESEDATEL
ncbi:bloated tubules [Tribolium castaneum]|uniref:Bloated tubules n=1 Tax=Tribolium castaneum TaxID=7070 RepID=B6CY69_TRICA|nr:bloated tubules [Tribolium castaneum]ACH86322.1 bloated tubules [Tribolium castaneum]|eukprot:NP_001137203.1 bloated tubules [Tribolium castaneum]